MRERISVISQSGADIVTTDQSEGSSAQLTVKIVTEVLHDVSVMAHDDEVWSPTVSGHKERLQMTLSLRSLSSCPVSVS